jgi:hypothetical protein
LFSQSLRALKLDGWLEIKEMSLPLGCDDGTLTGTSLERWTREMMKAGEMVGTAFDKPQHYQQWMTEAGFVNVQESIFRLPLNPWHPDQKLKELGTWQLMNFLDGVEGLTLFTEVLKWPKMEVDVFLAQVRKDVTNRNIHAYFNLVAVIGQKPPLRGDYAW